MNKQRLYELIPHREPMLLLDKVLELEAQRSKSEITISENSSFFVANKGVPSWIGVEYMGQTAALIAGFQLEQGTVEPHVGLLLGTRKYTAKTAWFEAGQTLLVSCSELAIVGQNLATFLCAITDANSGEELASAKLSVFRKPLDE